MTHFHAQCRSLSPFSCYPAWEITMASRPIVTHCHATILHFLWSILKSVQKEKHMKASSNTHTQKCTTHTPSISIASIHKDTSTQVKEQENKVTLKPNVKLSKTESNCLWLKGKNETKGILKKRQGSLLALIASASRSSWWRSWRWRWQAGQGPAQQRGGWHCRLCFPAYEPQTQTAWEDKEQRHFNEIRIYSYAIIILLLSLK